MKSFNRRRHSQPYAQAEALVDARNKVFNVIMAVLLVFTMLPITAFTYESQASAETLDSSGTTQVVNIQTIALIRLEEARQIVQPPQAVALLTENPQAQKTLTEVGLPQLQ